MTTTLHLSTDEVKQLLIQALRLQGHKPKAVTLNTDGSDDIPMMPSEMEYLSKHIKHPNEPY